MTAPWIGPWLHKLQGGMLPTAEQRGRVAHVSASEAYSTMRVPTPGKVKPFGQSLIGKIPKPITQPKVP